MEKPIEITHEAHASQSDEFCDHGGIQCPYCKLEVRIGHDLHGALWRHELPACRVFLFSEDTIQFMMLVSLKIRTDLSQRERN